MRGIPMPEKWYGYPARRNTDYISRCLQCGHSRTDRATLVKGQETRLTVSNKETGKTVLSIPLIDYALLVKGFYNRDMDDQEYLDRQDVYDMVFFLDESDRWLDAIFISILGKLYCKTVNCDRRNANEECSTIYCHGDSDTFCVMGYLV